MFLMKIGLVSAHSFKRPGGVKNHILHLQKEFRKRGHVCKIIAPRGINEKDYGKDVILLGTSFRVPVGGSQADITFNFTPGAIDSVLKKEKFDLLHFHNMGPLAWQVLTNPDLPKTNILTWHASFEGTNYFKHLTFMKGMMMDSIQDKISGIIGVAPFNLNIFKKIKKPKAVIPNGIDLTEFNKRVGKLSRYNDGKLNILFLGRIEERKGLFYLLRAYKILQRKIGRKWVLDNLRLIVVGQGPLKDELKEWTLKNKLENVVFVGQTVSCPPYYATCDIFCSPAIYGESFGIVLVEAMATGKPVVAFANAGYKTVLGHGRGKRFLAKPKDYRTLAKHLMTLIRSQKLRKEMGEWGYQEAKKYAWPKVAKQILDFYEYCRKEKEKFKV